MKIISRNERKGGGSDDCSFSRRFSGLWWEDSAAFLEQTWKFDIECWLLDIEVTLVPAPLLPHCCRNLPETQPSCGMTVKLLANHLDDRPNDLLTARFLERPKMLSSGQIFLSCVFKSCVLGLRRSLAGNNPV